MTLHENFHEAIREVETAFPSVYTKEDVVKLLKNLEAACLESASSVPPAFSEDDVSKLRKKISEAIEEYLDRTDAEDYIDNSSAEFSLHYNEVQLDRVDIDFSSLVTDLEGSIEDAIVNYFPAPSEEVTA